MAEVNPLILPIGADPRSLKASFLEVQTALKNLEKSLKGKKFSAITNEERQELEGYRRTLAALKNDLNGVSFDKLEKGSKNARTAVTSLNLVVQDLPFGFIAIQNNLPGLIQSFGQLSAASGGAVGALKAIGASLIGPAGLFLAFTAVTSAVTFAIQEYGSLRNAINVLFGANGAAVKAQNEFNKALLDGGGDAGVQIAKINILVKTIQSETSTQNERLAAYRELKKIAPEVVSGIDEQNLATSKSIKLIGENAKAVIELTKLQVKQRGIQAALSKLEEERFAINGKFNKAREEEINLQKEIAVAEQKRAAGEKISSRENQLLVKKDAFLQTAADRVQEFRDEVIKNTSAQDVWYKSLEQSITATSQISSNLETLQNKLEAETRSANDAADANKKLAKARAEQFRFAGDIRSLRNEKFLTEPILELPKKIDPKKYLEPIFRGLEKLPGAQIPALVELYFDEKRFKNIKDKLKDGIPEMEDFKENFIKNIIAEDLKGVDVTPELIIQRLNEQFKGLEKSIQVNEEFLNIFKLQKVLNDELNKQEKERIGNINSLAREFRFLQEPLADLIGTSLDGAGANWKEFADTVIQQIKRIIAALAAKALVQGLLNLLTPGGGGALSSLNPSQVVGLNQFQKGFFSPGFNLLGQANFAGLQPSGLQMGGQVNLTLRGNDLVGAINRTNTNINRVG
jgi:DNA repair exonuclease SbcCD ATPase subunit